MVGLTMDRVRCDMRRNVYFILLVLFLLLLATMTWGKGVKKLYYVKHTSQDFFKRTGLVPTATYRFKFSLG